MCSANHGTQHRDHTTTYTTTNDTTRTQRSAKSAACIANPLPSKAANRGRSIRWPMLGKMLWTGRDAATVWHCRLGACRNNHARPEDYTIQRMLSMLFARVCVSVWFCVILEFRISFWLVGFSVRNVCNDFHNLFIICNKLYCIICKCALVCVGVCVCELRVFCVRSWMGVGVRAHKQFRLYRTAAVRMDGGASAA